MVKSAVAIVHCRQAPGSIPGDRRSFPFCFLPFQDLERMMVKHSFVVEAVGDGIILVLCG